MEEISIKPSNNIKKGNYHFKTNNKKNILKAFYSLIKNLHIAYKTKKDMVSIYNKDSDFISISQKEKERFNAISEDLYRVIKGKRFNGIISPYSEQENAEVKQKLDELLLDQISTLEKICPYIDFSGARKKAKKVVYRVRTIPGNCDESVKGSSAIDYPIINLNYDEKTNKKEYGIQVVKHEFTHFSCDKLDENIDYYRYISTFLNEGITQRLTIKSLGKNINEETLYHANSVYPLNTKYADFYIDLIGEKPVFTSYFKRNRAYINEAIKEVSKRFTPVNLVIDNNFLSDLSKEENNLHMYLYNSKPLNKKITIENFKNIYSFLMYMSSIYDLQPDYVIANEKKQEIWRYIDEINITLDEIYKKRTSDSNRNSR